jgi:Putative quorum-sensing-regulated virulence factor
MNGKSKTFPDRETGKGITPPYVKGGYSRNPKDQNPKKNLPMIPIPPKAEKLLRLALDAGACEGEWQTAARMFVASLRKAGCKAESLLAPPSQSHRKTAPPPWKSRPTKMPFGMHKGKSLSDLPDAYLDWLATLADLQPELKKAVKAELARRAD